MELPVSVAVTTFNSAFFVVETLESIKAQTYKNIELIISDDGSADNTIELCKEWIAANGGRFIGTAVLTVAENTGVSANCNRCIKTAKFDWIKFIAGDDILLPNCIEDNMRFVAANKDAAIIFSQVLLYEDEFKEERFMAAIPGKYPMNLMNPDFTAQDQYKLLLVSDRITYTPSYFFKKQALLDVGCYEEENKLVEDYPMWLKLTKAGSILFYFNKPTVGYRRHSAALNNTKNDGLFKPLFLKMAPLKEKLVYPYLPWDIAGSEKHILILSKFFQRAGLNKNRSLNAWLYKIAIIYCNPFRYVIFFKKRFLKTVNNNIFYADY
jgi:glycosyltransferase involved in cell wall biosynthesis